ncbi:hypothetical protein A2368_00670 [Candidatus Collierbacteria bacterium RIFOXYB1_FULL_49_13]|uniref:Uncharacterized protein n=1 Tax=Candidatus Collierbacteria bacterium RIFOXYB1_FULL_49_13 TaxID=1817728 RepID=A0A1F5FHI7_9BACT|nr:MAG: hypothetical protein A2368_00670 [Candidatus Collierbacteria bacterium RIFOXYB1_FULL_49_13]
MMAPFVAFRWVSGHVEPVTINHSNIHLFHFCPDADSMIHLTQSGQYHQTPVYVSKAPEPERITVKQRKPVASPA